MGTLQQTSRVETTSPHARNAVDEVALERTHQAEESWEAPAGPAPWATGVRLRPIVWPPAARP